MHWNGIGCLRRWRKRERNDKIRNASWHLFADCVRDFQLRFDNAVALTIPMKPISIPIDRDQCSGLDPISGRSEATLAVAFCGK